MGHLRRHEHGRMFQQASSFNQDKGGWVVDSVLEHGTDVRSRLGLRPGPRLVRGRRREPGSGTFTQCDDDFDGSQAPSSQDMSVVVEN